MSNIEDESPLPSVLQDVKVIIDAEARRLEEPLTVERRFRKAMKSIGPTLRSILDDQGSRILLHASVLPKDDKTIE